MTARLLDFAHGPLAVPAPVRARALMLLEDTLAVGVAGSTAPGADGVLTAARRWGAGDEVPILGRDVRLPRAGAAFVNGYQIHCLEWDAVHEPAVVHAMSVVTAVVLSAARGKPAEAALEAVMVGVETACLLGVAATSPLKFFRPATAGVIGGALAAARLAGLPRERFGDVLGLAHAQAAGTMQAHVEGSVALPLQVAAAARAAVTAVDLVEAGLTGPQDALTGPFGYFPVFDQGDPLPLLETLGTHWRVGEISVKPWPSGRASHATLAAIADVLQDAPAADILRIEAEVPQLIARLVGRPWREGMTPAYARLCLPFLAALMLRDGRIDPREFIAQGFADDRLKALAARLDIRVDGNPDPNALAPQRFRFHLAGGHVRELKVPATLGSPANDLTEAQQAAKIAFALALGVRPQPVGDPLAVLTGADG
ncbi:MAG: MmgE/PrpD family protein [Polymorphobacter sp.]|uniref:MmgE/PrpD family protein n=1 Tax=Polymorphobacter sp. TaxID=1909290 RepID=UPI003A86A693